MHNTVLESKLARIESLHPKNIDLGLERVKSVANNFIPLTFECPVVLVAGTNGKGSTVAFLSTIAQMNGLNVATYTSPHLITFNERIQVNNQNISDDDLLKALEAVEAARGDTSLTYFEYTTLAALYYFHQVKPDLIILEVGMGGRLDATNIVEPDISIITSIGFDHTEYLGDTLEKIAYEKAGIVRVGKPVIYSDPMLDKFVGANTHFVIPERRSLTRDLVGFAIHAAKLLNLNIPDTDTIIKQTSRPARQELKTITTKKVLFDVAHNEDSLQSLKNCIETHQAKRIHLVLGVMGDKNVEDSLKALSSTAHLAYLAKPKTHRAMCVQILKDFMQCEAESFDSVPQAFEQALSRSDDNDLIVVTGSFYTVGEVYT